MSIDTGCLLGDLLPAAGFGLSKFGLGKVGVVESLGKAEPALLDDLGNVEVRWLSSLLYEVALNLTLLRLA